MRTKLSNKKISDASLSSTANKLSSMTFAIVDVETTGSSPTFDRVIEIGILRVEQGRIVKTYRSFLDPQKTLPPSITQITGITRGDLEGAPYFADIAHEVSELLQGAVFVAHNARFDYGFIKNELKRAGVPFSARCLCTVRLSRRLFPSHRHHDLSSLIERFGLSCDNRHRAFDDAQVLWQLLQHLDATDHDGALAAAIDALVKGSSLPPFLDERTVASLPENAGVYIFYGADDEVLYVGKSKSLRTRILSHFSGDHAASKESTISQQTVRVETHETPGELSALLLESKLVKELRPLYNRQLRRKRELVVAMRDDTGAYPTVTLVTTGSIEPGEYDQALGIFRNVTQAKMFLRNAVMEHALCPKLLGLEKGTGACFYEQMGKCKGACRGEESPESYGKRLHQAFGDRRIKAWPYAGPIVISEHEDDETTQSYILDNWCLVGDIAADADTTRHNVYTPAFDYDSYKIFLRFLQNPLNRKRVKDLSPQEAHRVLDREYEHEPTVFIE